VKRSGRDESKRFVFLIIAYVFSSIKLEKRAEQFLQKRFVFLIIALCLLFNKTVEKGRTGSAWNKAGGEERGR
jgi:hypothetical protein